MKDNSIIARLWRTWFKIKPSPSLQFKWAYDIGMIQLKERELCAKTCDLIAQQYYDLKWVDHRNQDRGFTAAKCAREIRKLR